MAGPLPIGEPWPGDRLPVSPSKISLNNTLHAYLHIPFCEVRCGYCDFNTYTAVELGAVSRSDFDNALTAEIDYAARLMSSAPKRELTTVFFGGGTPTLFSAEQFDRLIMKLDENFGIATGAEITVEANPDTLSAEYLEQLAAVGVTRVSMGVQSFDRDVLAVLDRSHDPEGVAPAVEWAKAAGLQVSIDLIYGSPGETLASWRTTLEQALALESDHLSAYALIVEQGTALERRIRRGDLAGVDDDLQADMYELLTDLTGAAGMTWYEISNWSRTSESIHNLAYWRSQDWWGFGPGAHSHLAGVRWWNHKHPTRYLAALNVGSPAAGLERLTQAQRLDEQIMLGLRTRYGVAEVLLTNRGVDSTLIEQLVSEGQLERTDGSLRATVAGRLRADGIALDLISSAID